MTTALARLDYRTADAAQAAITNLIAAPTEVNGHAIRSHPKAAPGVSDRDAELVAAAARIVARARHDGRRLGQAALASRLRRDGYTVANDRLRWLSAASGLEAHHTERDGGPPGG
jgi:hypothetical protein